MHAYKRKYVLHTHAHCEIGTPAPPQRYLSRQYEQVFGKRKLTYTCLYLILLYVMIRFRKSHDAIRILTKCLVPLKVFG